MEGRGVLKSTLTMLSVLGERMKARDPRRSPCERICLHKPGQGAPQASPGSGTERTEPGEPAAPGSCHLSARRAEISEATAKALLELS